MPERNRKAKKRQNEQVKRHSPHEALVKALNHPIRAKALTILTKRVASPKEIAELLEIRLSNVSYHVRVLADLGLIELQEEEPVRGAVVHFYKAIDRPLVDNADWRKLDTKVRNAFSGYQVDALISDAAKSLSAGIFDQRADRQLTRMPLQLDEQGWRQVAEICEEAGSAILKAQAAATDRLNGSHHAPIHAIAALLLFEAAL